MNNFKYVDITLGADPEVFLYDVSLGRFIISCDKVGGTKEAPIPLPGYEKSKIQEDNVTVEFNIVPCVSKSDWVNELSKTMNTLNKYVSGLTSANCSIQAVPSVIFSEKDLQHPKALVFGCEPDYNAWTKEENDFVQLSGEKARMRTAGGHVHVGYKNPSVEASLNLGRAMDVFLGVPAVVLDEDGKDRRDLYGKAGAIRFKPYGVEYRTLSNFWLNSGSYLSWVYDQTMKAVNYLNKGNTIDESDGELIQEIINTGDNKKAISLYKKYPIL